MSPTPTITTRRFRPTLLAAAAAATAALFATAAVQAQEKTIYIGMNGGDMERSYSKYVFPAFEKIHGVKVVVVPGTSSDILAKVQASKEKPPVHVMFLHGHANIERFGSNDNFA